MDNAVVENIEIKDNKFKEYLPIIIILLVSAFLNLWRVWAVSYANEYYAAGVYSMGQNLHAFFFNSFDSAGFITIDKPPLGFWIQVLSTKVFGFNSVALILPEAIAAVCSVYLIYRIIRKRFSKGAGLFAAAILALTPIFVAVSRNNTIDAVLILFLLLASQQALLATEKSSMKHLILAGVFIGLGFNVKMLQAYMIVPAIYLTYLILAKQKFFKKVLVCAVSVIVMLAISLSWVVAVDMVSEENRPYIGSSDTNSAVNLVIGYNGLNRIFSRGNSKGNDNNADNVQDKQNANLDNINRRINQSTADNQGTQYSLDNRNNRNNPNNQAQLPQNNANRTANNSNTGKESGDTGLFRLYNDNNAGQISWFILPAILTCIYMLVLIFRRNFKSNPRNITLLFFVLCFIPMFIYFSFASGLAHRYYLATIAPFIAGVIGAGFYYLRKAKTYWMPIIFALTALAQLYIQYLYKGWIDWLLPVCAVIFALVAVAMIIAVIKKAGKKIYAVLLCVLLILPVVWSATPILYGDNSQLPVAGPELIKSSDKFDKQYDLSGVIEYLEENREEATYLAMTTSAMNMGAELILQSGEAVMALGGFNGGDSPLTLDEFVNMVKDNEVRYAVISSSNNGNSQIFNWIKNKGTVINPSEYGGNLGQGITVYRLTKN